MTVSAPSSTTAASRPAAVRVLALLLSIVALASACGVSRSDRAAVAASVTFVDGSELDIDAERVEALRGEVLRSEAFNAIAFAGAEPLEVDQEMLTRLIHLEVYRNTAEALGAEIDPAVETEVADSLRTQLESALVGAGNETPVDDVYEEISGFLGLIVETEGLRDAIGTVLVEGEQGFACASHILVETEDEALDLLSQLEGGADFAELAIEFSLDPGSGANGGELGCADPANYVAEFAEAITTGTEGEIMGPIETQFGFHLIVITGYGEPVADDLVYDRIVADLTETVVVVDDAIGIWNPAALAVVGSATS